MRLTVIGKVAYVYQIRFDGYNVFYISAWHCSSGKFPLDLYVFYTSVFRSWIVDVALVLVHLYNYKEVLVSQVFLS